VPSRPSLPRRGAASTGRAQRIKARGVGISVAFDDATDCRCHRGQLVVGKVNCRHGPDIIGRDLSSKATCLAACASRIWPVGGIVWVCGYVPEDGLALGTGRVVTYTPGEIY
jgi:hypothetical protein